MKNILFFLSLFSFILPLQISACPTAFTTGTGFAIIRDFRSGREVELQKILELISVYNPKLDLQLKREGYSRETFQRKIDLDNQAVEFLQNFYTSNVRGKNSFFVGEIKAYATPSSVPLIGRIVRRTGRRTAIVEVITLSGNVEKAEVAVEASFHFDFYNEGTKDKFGDGFKVFIKSNDFSVSIQKGHPDLEMVFTALRSNRRRLSFRLSDDILQSKEEQSLKARGFNSAYTRGINEVNEWIAVADQMRKLEVNPYKTHIDYLADKARDHIAYIREGLTSSGGRAIRNLNRLERIVEHAIQERGVTYSWWLRFNYALSRVYGYDDVNSSGMKLPRADERHLVNRFPTHADERHLVNRFPTHIVMPTIVGKMGVMAINRANRYNIHPVGLLKQEERGDGLRMMGPTQFFNHDIRHAIRLINMSSTYFVAHYGSIYDRLWQEVETLPVGKRQNVELALFALIHEGGRPFVTEELFMIRSHILGTLEGQVRFDFNFNGLLPDTSSKDRMIEQVREIAVDFSEIFSQVREQTRSSIESVSISVNQ